jgi:predicted RND superfamily exporter protein
VALSLGVAGLLLPSIHIISFAFMALIIGLGTDYSIHLYDRFHTERASGRSTENALRLTLLDTGHGVFTAAVTTALPFLALCGSDVRALSELGLLVGLGVIFSLYATFFFLPPLLIFMERRFPVTYRPIPPLGLGRVWRLAQRRPVAVIVVSVVLLLVFGVASLRTAFDGELKNLQPRHSEAFLAQEKIERHLSLAPKQMLVALEGHDLHQVLERAARVERLAAGLAARGEITAWSSLGKVLNGPAQQAEVTARMRTLFAGGSAAEVLKGGLERQGFAVDSFSSFLEAVGSWAHSRPVPADEAMARLASSPLKGVVDRHLVKDAAGYHALVYLHYRGAEFKGSAFLAELAAIDPSARASSVDLVSSQLAESVKRSFVWGLLLGGTLVLFLLLAQFFESPVGVCYALFPVTAGSLAMLGAMALAGMKLNFMNAMVLVTILGMGSDFGLYIRYRVRAALPAEREAQFIQTGRAVLLSALTTITGFGSLAFTDYGAMSSIGWATNLGIGFVTFFSLVTLPAVLQVVTRHPRKATTETAPSASGQ